MHRTAKRLITMTGATVGALALFTGTAAAHYCYFAAPAGSQAVKGQAWSSAEDTVADLAGLQAAFAAVEKGQVCQHAVAGIIADVEEMPAGTLFMGPGLLAAGAIHHGKDMKRMGHLAFGDVPESCWMLLGPPEA